MNAAKSFKPLTGTQVSALLAQTQNVAREGKFELYKTSEKFDTTAKRPEYLG